MPIARRPICAACCCASTPSRAMMATKPRHAARIFIRTDIKDSCRERQLAAMSLDRYGHLHARVNTATDLEASSLVESIFHGLSRFLQTQICRVVVLIQYGDVMAYVILVLKVQSVTRLQVNRFFAKLLAALGDVCGGGM